VDPIITNERKKKMINQQTYKQLTDMKMYAMAAAFGQYLQRPVHDALSFEERFGMLVEREHCERQQRRLKKRLTQAKLREPACVEDIDYQQPRGLDRSVLQRLASCQWVTEHQNILLTGATGLGKTWLACALVNRACREGFSALYLRAPRILADMLVARGSGSYSKLIERLAKPDVLVLDDFGLSKLGDTERRDLLEIIEERQGRKSTIIASQLEIKHWHEIIAEPTIADAILDRLINSAHRIEMHGKLSMRANRKEKKAPNPDQKPEPTPASPAPNRSEPKPQEILTAKK
jgi:DNA replication protein DnaC